MGKFQEVLERRKGRFSYLLALMLIQLLISPWAQSSAARYRILGLFAAATVLAALYTVSQRRRVWIAAIIIAVPTFLHRITVRPDLQNATQLVGLGFSILFDFFITALILDEILRHEAISNQTIYGALCTYLTAGFAFGQIFLLVATVRPGSFVLDPHLFTHAIPTQADLMYYSYTTLTTLGPMGIAPAAPYARCLSMIEGVLGVVYLTVLLGRLVGLHVSQRIVSRYSDEIANETAQVGRGA
jgi:hypothetical protein